MPDEKPDLLSVWVALGGDEPRRSSGWVKLRCLLHEERNASATFNEDAQRFNCFVCLDKPIDVYELVMRVEGLEDFSEAKARAEVLAGSSRREVRGKHDEGGPRIPGQARRGRGGRTYSPAWRSTGTGART